MNYKFISGWFRSAVSALFPLLVLIAAPSAHGALIGVPPSYPDITDGANTDITYNWTGSSGTMTINGRFGTLSDQTFQKVAFSALDNNHQVCNSNVLNSTCNAVSATNYTLTANFNAGGLFSGGTLSISGYIDGDPTTSGYQPLAGYTSGTLLTANLTAMGFYGQAGDSTYDQIVLDFTGNLTGGDFYNKSYGNDVGLRWGGRVNSSGLAPYGGSWDTLMAGVFQKSFACTSGCQSSLDTYVVPVPAAVWLFGSGLIGLIGVGRRGRRATHSE